MRQEVRWTDLTYEQIADHLAEAGTPVSVPVVKQLLRKHGYVKRKAQKSKAMGGHADRNQQFENIARLKREYLASGWQWSSNPGPPGQAIRAHLGHFNIANN